MAPEGRSLAGGLDKPARKADIQIMTKFRFHRKFLLNAGNTLNRR